MTMTGDRPPDRPDTSPRDRCQRPAQDRHGRIAAAGGVHGFPAALTSFTGYDSQARGRQAGLRPARR